MTTKQAMSTQLITGEQSLLNILTKGAQGNAEKSRCFLCSYETVIVSSVHFIPTSRNQFFRTNRTEKSEGSWAESPSTRF